MSNRSKQMLEMAKMASHCSIDNNVTSEENLFNIEDMEIILFSDNEVLFSNQILDVTEQVSEAANENGLNKTNENIFHGDMKEGRKRSINADSNVWKRNKNKMLRMEGNSYLGYTRKNGKVEQNKMREERTLGPTCTSKLCQSSKLRQCSEFSEKMREDLFFCFWKESTWDQRKIFVASHVNRTATKRKCTDNDSRRMGTFHYHLPLNGQNVPVCKKMFLKTLALGSFTVQSWVNKSTHNLLPGDTIRISKRNLPASNKTGDMQFLDNFFELLPKLPSHYSRATSSKLYLEPIIKTMKELMDLYKEKCREHQRTPLSRQVFSKAFKLKNLSLHQTKKDRCDTCVSHEAGNLTEDEWLLHINQKNRAREEKSADKNRAIQNECITLCMDLQSVKLAPNISASAIFFKTKLCCYNFTIYDLKSHRATCFWFTEVDSDLTASTFTSCVIDYLTTHCIDKKLPIILYSDGCTYQNRNATLSNALLHLAVIHKAEITQKFLERGHTQMECDSVHSAIERKIKGREIYLPSDYVKATKEARTKPFPYDVKVLDYNFFLNYNTDLTYTSIRPGRMKNDPTVTNIRAIKYDTKIQVRLNFPTLCSA